MTTKKREVRKLNIKIAELFKKTYFEIAGDKIEIQPFSLEQWINLISRGNDIIDKFTAAGITLENYKSPSNIAKIVKIILVDFPDILEEATGIDAEDIQALPPEYSIALITKVIEVQIESKDDFLKNLNCLTAKLPIEVQGKVNEMITPKVE